MHPHPLNLLGIVPGQPIDDAMVHQQFKSVRRALHPDKLQRGMVACLAQAERDGVCLDEVSKLSELLNESEKDCIASRLQTLLEQQDRPYRSTWNPFNRDSLLTPLCYEIPELQGSQLPQKYTSCLLKELELRDDAPPSWLSKALNNSGMMLARLVCADTQIALLGRFLPYTRRLEERVEFLEEHARRLDTSAASVRSNLAQLLEELENHREENKLLQVKVSRLHSQITELEKEPVELRDAIFRVLSESRKREEEEEEEEDNDDDDDDVIVVTRISTPSTPRGAQSRKRPRPAAS